MNIRTCLLSFLTITALGCTSFKIEDSGVSESGTTPPTTGDRPLESGLPDWSWDLDDSGCEVQEATGVAGPGATSYFHGLYNRTGSGFTGYEEWILFANDAWESDGGRDCTIRWSVSAEQSDTEACGVCDLGIAVLFTLDEGRSDCPDDLIEDASSSLSTHYDVLQNSSGDTSWFFSGSGNQFGTGSWNDEALNFISPKSCSWF
jgi:hypothetical protein